MIQRVQTLYYLAAILLSASVLFGLELFSIHTKETQLALSIFGTTQKSVPLYIGTIILIVKTIYVMLLYKNLRLQLLFTKTLIAAYIIWAAVIFVLAFHFNSLFANSEASTHIRFGFAFLLISCIPLFLAMLGVKKDKKLLDSLNRLR